MYALFLHKGHNKEKTLDSSYRTISTCPLIAKGLDIYVRELSLSRWNAVQAPTQYQGEGSSHELMQKSLLRLNPNGGLHAQYY